jgi:SAM-dependent methyltransferase
MTAEPRLTDYRTHYRVDADLIQDPQDLQPVRSDSERRRLETIRAELALRPGELLLDLGCGSGWLSHLCQTTGARIVAADIAATGVAAARARYPEAAQYTTGDVYHVGLASATFDAVVLSEVVEHLEDPAAGIAEATRLLRPGGRLLITVPYRETIVEHLCVHCNRLTPANAHLHSFDEAALGELTSAAGLRTVRSRRMTNKLLELSGFPERSRRWPHGLWRAVDGLLNAVTGKPAFLLSIAHKA